MQVPFKPNYTTGRPALSRRAVDLISKQSMFTSHRANSWTLFSSKGKLKMRSEEELKNSEWMTNVNCVFTVSVSQHVFVTWGGAAVLMADHLNACGNVLQGTRTDLGADFPLAGDQIGFQLHSKEKKRKKKHCRLLGCLHLTLVQNTSQMKSNRNVLPLSL